MIKILTVEEMRAVEAAADKAGVSYAQLMDSAGRAVADRGIEHVRALVNDGRLPQPRVAVLVGPGNNGGDGLVAGRLIAEETPAAVSFFLTKTRDDSDPNFAKVMAAKLLVVDAANDAEQGYRVLRTMVANADVLIDALLGTGTKLPLRGEMVKILRQVRQALDYRTADRPPKHYSTPTTAGFEEQPHPVIIAVDMPTGMDGDTGELDKNTLFADETVTFEGPRPGHLTFPGADAVGTLHVAPLGLPTKLKERDSIKHNLADAATIRDLLPARPANANKGTFGKALIVAGSANYTGAPVLSAKAAYRVGTGLVTLAVPERIAGTLNAHLLESTWLLLPDDLGMIKESAAEIVRREMATYSALLIGPGLNHEKTTQRFLKALLSGSDKKSPKILDRRIGFSPGVTLMERSEPAPKGNFPPLVIDADGLNMLARMNDWWTLLPPRTILTPHAGEMARLAQIAADENRSAAQVVQADRLGLATTKAKAWNCIVVLKGAFTVIADPDGRITVIPFANAALARAGTGDVLAGMIVGYLAQGLDPFDAAVAAAYLHGYAGELASIYVGTKASVLASDVVAAIPDAISAVETFA